MQSSTRKQPDIRKVTYILEPHTLNRLCIEPLNQRDRHISGKNRDDRRGWKILNFVLGT